MTGDSDTAESGSDSDFIDGEAPTAEVSRDNFSGVPTGEGLDATLAAFSLDENALRRAT